MEGFLIYVYYFVERGRIRRCLFRSFLFFDRDSENFVVIFRTWSFLSILNVGKWFLDEGVIFGV